MQRSHYAGNHGERLKLPGEMRSKVLGHLTQDPIMRNINVGVLSKKDRQHLPYYNRFKAHQKNYQKTGERKKYHHTNYEKNGEDPTYGDYMTFKEKADKLAQKEKHKQFLESIDWHH